MADPVQIAVVVTDGSALKHAILAEGGEVFHARLKAAGIAEALIIETRDGMDIHVIADGKPSRVRAILEECIGARARMETLTGTDALRRLLFVAAAPEKLAVADSQGSGVLNESHRRAWVAGMIGDALHNRLQLAYRVARHARSETVFPDRPVSIVSSAVRVARSIHGDLSRVRGLLIGTEEAGEMIAARLLKDGLAELAVMHERRHLADEAAGRLGTRTALAEDIERELAGADIVILSAGTGRHAVSAADLQAALAARRRKPVFLVDAGVPPDADPAIETLDDVFLYNLDHLERIALEDRTGREDGEELASALVEETLATFAESAPGSDESEQSRMIRETLEDARRRILAGAPDADAFESTRALVDLLAGRAGEALADPAGSNRSDELAGCVRFLFGQEREKGS